jgi:hypothetical protein
MDSITYIFIVSMVVFIGASFYVWLKFLKKETKREVQSDESKKVILQAYERLTLLVSRIALPALISRLNVPNSEVRDMQQLLVQTIKEEFEFNVSQQIYVSTNAWGAIKTLRDQNILIINQTAASLPQQASGGDLSRIILDFLMNDQRGNLHELVSDVLAEEAKKIMSSTHFVYKD